MADRIASNDGDFQTKILQILHGSRLSFFMRFQRESNVGILRRLRNRRRYLQIVNRTQQPVFTDAVGINTYRLATRRFLRGPFPFPALGYFVDGRSGFLNDFVSVRFAQSHLGPRGPAARTGVSRGAASSEAGGAACEDAMTVLAHNHASTSDDDLFGAFTICP